MIILDFPRQFWNSGMIEICLDDKFWESFLALLAKTDRNLEVLQNFHRFQTRQTWRGRKQEWSLINKHDMHREDPTGQNKYSAQNYPKLQTIHI